MEILKIIFRMGFRPKPVIWRCFLNKKSFFKHENRVFSSTSTPEEEAGTYDVQLASTLVLRRVTLVRARVGSESDRLRRVGGRAGGSVGCMASGAESFNSVRDGHAAARAAFAVSLHDLGQH